jgi:hypothetical protein
MAAILVAKLGETQLFWLATHIGELWMNLLSSVGEPGLTHRTIATLRVVGAPAFSSILRSKTESEASKNVWKTKWSRDRHRGLGRKARSKVQGTCQGQTLPKSSQGSKGKKVSKCLFLVDENKWANPNSSYSPPPPHPPIQQLSL